MPRTADRERAQTWPGTRRGPAGRVLRSPAGIRSRAVIVEVEEAPQAGNVHERFGLDLHVLAVDDVPAALRGLFGLREGLRGDEVVDRILFGGHKTRFEDHALASKGLEDLVRPPLQLLGPREPLLLAVRLEAKLEQACHRHRATSPHAASNGALL